MGYLMHYGVKGMKWGVRKKFYGKTLFVSGSSKTQDKDSGYYRKRLNRNVRKELNRTMRAKGKILVGDAPGIDRQVQNYLKSRWYKNVVVYSPGTTARYIANRGWRNTKVDAPEYEPGSKEWLAKKDIRMTNDSERGLAVILDEGSRATKNNVHRLVKQNKDVAVAMLSGKGKKWDIFVDWDGDLHN